MTREPLHINDSMISGWPYALFTRELEIVGRSPQRSIGSRRCRRRSIARSPWSRISSVCRPDGYGSSIRTRSHLQAPRHAQPLPPSSSGARASGSGGLCIEEFRNGSRHAQLDRDGSARACAPARAREQNDLTQMLRITRTVPLSFQNKQLGIMNITAPAMRRLTREELRLLGTIGLQVGVGDRARAAGRGERHACEGGG